MLRANVPAHLILQKVLDAIANHDIEQAASIGCEALSQRTLDRTLASAVVSLVSDTWSISGEPSAPSITRLLVQAVDQGMHLFAYNAANQLSSQATGPDDYRRAKAYYEIAMAYTEKPALQAAAHVNYCPIVRDGLITGEPDWKTAVEIYEVAARMGLMKAMFNAGNVSRWLVGKGDAEYGERALKWFQAAVDHFESGAPTLDMEPREELQSIVDQCRCEIAALNIDGHVLGADRDRGIDLVFPLAERGHEVARSYLTVGLYERLRHIDATPSASPGLNWRAVLTALGWKITPAVTTERYSVNRELLTRPHETDARVDALKVKLASGKTLPLLVVHEPCLPLRGGMDLLDEIASEAHSRHRDGFFLVPRKAFFVLRKQRVYTPIIACLGKNQGATIRSLWLGATPDALLDQARQQAPFDDPAFSCDHCMISIAVNVLDEGCSVANDADPRQPYIEVGDRWCMPYLSEARLLDLGLMRESRR